MIELDDDSYRCGSGDYPLPEDSSERQGRATPRRPKPDAPQPLPDEFDSVSDWVRVWMAPTIARKLTGQGKGLTWCAPWWQHREVAMRMYALWRAWEAARTSDDTSMSTWWVHHADPHLRVVLDGENGPLYRCGARHLDTAALHTVEVPDGWFGSGLDPSPGTRRRHGYMLGPDPAPPVDGGDTPRAEVFASFVEWVEVWLAPALARKLGGQGKGLTWCAQWWQHREVAVRLHALWRAWESAVADGGPALSSWWVHGLDPHLRILLHAEHGPMYRCTVAAHHAVTALDTSPTPLGWFDNPHVGSNPACDPFGGFGPDPRVLARGVA